MPFYYVRMTTYVFSEFMNRNPLHRVPMPAITINTILKSVLYLIDSSSQASNSKQLSRISLSVFLCLSTAIQSALHTPTFPTHLNRPTIGYIYQKLLEYETFNQQFPNVLLPPNFRKHASAVTAR